LEWLESHIYPYLFQHVFFLHCFKHIFIRVKNFYSYEKKNILRFLNDRLLSHLLTQLQL
jgi:hypothetical protein